MALVCNSSGIEYCFSICSVLFPVVIPGPLNLSTVQLTLMMFYLYSFLFVFGTLQQRGLVANNIGRSVHNKIF